MPTEEVRYLYDGRLPIQERNGYNIPLVTYTRGTDLSGSREGAGGIGGLLARTDQAQISPAHAYYHADGNGNVTALIDAQQRIAARYIYDPYGNTLALSGPLAEANLYRFSSKEAHSASGLVYYLYRYYDPNLQRWVNRDPIQELGGFNLYSFVGNSSLQRVDPWGLDYGDWWDPRTWFNSGFTESWYESSTSIGQALGGALARNWDQVADAYDTGVFGQTQDADPATKYGTRGAIGVATACAVSACAVGGLQAIGCPTMNVAVGPGRPALVHVAYGTECGWVHATGALGAQTVSGDAQPAIFAEGFSWFTVTGIPVLFPEAVVATGMPASTCIGAACRAFFRGWGL